MSTQKPTQPRPDPLIDEIRDIRADISNQFDNDARKLGKHLQELEKQLGDRVKAPVKRDRPSRRPPT